MLTIDCIGLVESVDPAAPDWLGEYCDSATPSELDSGRAILRENVRPLARKYFRPANPECGQEEYERMEAYNRGNWYLVHIQAEARISYMLDSGGSRLQTLVSAGLGGIANDGDGTYFDEVANEELRDLREQLEAFGVNMSNFDDLARKAELCNA